jgi:hypothetical protein
VGYFRLCPLIQSISGLPRQISSRWRSIRLDIPGFWDCSKVMAGRHDRPGDLEGKTLRSRVPLLGKWRGDGAIVSATERVDVGVGERIIDSLSRQNIFFSCEVHKANSFSLQVFCNFFPIIPLRHILNISAMAVKLWNGKPLSLKVIGTNAGTSMDGLDIAHIHYTQESPDAPLKMRLLRAGEVAFDGELKSNCCKRCSKEKLLTRY